MAAPLVESGSDKGFNVQQLLDISKEYFNLPSAFVKFAYSICRPGYLIGNKLNDLLIYIIPNSNPA